MLILGQNKVVVFRDPKGWEVRYWAERGLIKMEDSRHPNEITTFTTMREVLVRLKCVNEMLGRSSDPGVEVDPQERHRLQTFVEQMVELVRYAREQGNPIDQGKVRNLGKHDPCGLPRSTRVLIPNNFFLD